MLFISNWFKKGKMKNLWRSIKIYAVFTLFLGLIYPLLLTFVAQLSMPYRANGSLIIRENRIVGSSLISQRFLSPKYFQARPSAVDYDAAGSGASNLGPSSEKLMEQTAARVKKARVENSYGGASLPADMVLASASGLDPHISPENAAIQSKRIQNLRGIPADKMNELIEENTDDDMLGLWGCEGVNVLKLNCALDDFEKGKK